MPPKNNIYAIIVNYNNARDTIACLKSLKRFKQITPILVDNASVDGSLAIIQKAFPDLKIIRSEQNLGFAGGNNLGIRYALKQKAAQILLLNNDTIVEDHKFFDYLQSTEADIVAPILKFKRDRQTVYDHGGIVDHWLGRNTHIERGRPLARPPLADYYSGTCLLIKSPVFKKIGYLDDQYFMYYEDVDFCLRARRNGLRISLSPKAILTHSLSATAGRNAKLKLHYLRDSHLRFILRHLTPLSWPLALGFNFYLTLKSF